MQFSVVLSFEFKLDKRKHGIVDDVVKIGIDAFGDEGLALVVFDLLDAQELHQDDVGQ